VGLVVAIVPALAELYPRWGIDSMWCRSFTQRPGRHVVCLVVLIVVARGVAWVMGTGVAGGPVLLHVTPSFMGARLAAGRSPQLIIARLTTVGIGVTLCSSFLPAGTSDGFIGPD
jgi:hypothetical protein